ncbi:nucleotidyltransferase family protein [uncultured Tateyamaria sp.]|uniref:nucleotidyltransferase family protein n=1 Tax=uncultured Tateyamaria sp. TaxID=455651 RepID=UPI002603DDF6|nr:nucleotidyltransferase family protein [uncultured Tateyamaria sp.]
MMPILILAAGSSSRMRGRDKLLERVDGEPLLARQIAMAQSISHDVRVALPPAPHPRHAIAAKSGARCVIVPDADEGMGASLRTIFGTLRTEPCAMLLLADLPDISADDLRAVQNAVQDVPDALIWRGATANGQGGHPIVFHHSLFPAISKLSGDDGGRGVVQSAGTRVHLVPLQGNRARLDLDTPEDWAAWRAARQIT